MTGDEARALRRGIGLSARQLADQCGTTESSIYRWEKLGEDHVPRMYELALRYLFSEYQRRRRPIDQEDCG